jgi:hypothetical protein
MIIILLAMITARVKLTIAQKTTIMTILSIERSPQDSLRPMISRVEQRPMNITTEHRLKAH